MDCGELNKLMDPFLDRQLSESSADEMRDHLKSCQVCRGRWGQLMVLLSDPEPVEVPAGLRDRIMTAWESRTDVPGIMLSAAASSSPWRRHLTGLRYVGAIAACVVFFVTGWLLSGRWGDPQPAPVVTDSGRREMTVVVSPWILSSMAQAAAMPAPVSPVVMLAGGVVPEMMIPEPRADEPMPWVYERPTPGSASQPSDSATPEIPLLPLVPRYLGA